jgi:hypothetical protein
MSRLPVARDVSRAKAMTREWVAAQIFADPALRFRR